MKKIKIGVMGAYRGTSMINYCKRADNAEVVAICDKNPDALESQKENAKGFDITYYDNFDEFIKHDMDAVVLANYAHEHAPFAIRAMKKGKHVFSEVLPCQTMKEAVELIETIEETNMIYAYGENYCYMPAPYEMKKLYQAGKIGELEYAECEYVHNCDPIWHAITYGEKEHWRNNMYATFYCTHSLGPIIHATKLRPVSVVGFEGPQVARKRQKGSKSGSFGMEIVHLENGGIIKSLHGGLYKDNIWYCMYGSKGVMESGRENAENSGFIHKIHINADEYECGYDTAKKEFYEPVGEMKEKTEGFGHGGSDFYSMYNFIERLRGNEKADIIDVYEALDMFLPGMFAYRSILQGGVTVQIPNLRNKAEREKWRNDTACTDPQVAGDMLIPVFSKGTPEIEDSVYDYVKQLWDEECQKKDEGYRSLAFSQSSEKGKDAIES